MDKPVDAIVVPVGGGGLIAGISVAMKHLSPDTEVIVSHIVCQVGLKAGNTFFCDFGFYP